MRGFNIFEILAIRSGGSLVILLALLVVRPELRVHALPRRMGLNALRNTVHYASQYAWALSLTMLPLAMVFALEFTMPAWTALLAVWLLHERMSPSRIGVVVFGLDRRAGDPAARHRQLQPGGLARAGRGRRLRHHHDHHQEAHHDGDHVRDHLLDGGHAVSALADRQRPARVSAPAAQAHASACSASPSPGRRRITASATPSAPATRRWWCRSISCAFR